MLLTGFDSKYLNTLYVDKNLKHHGLIQAFSRTNRVLNDTKPYGNILDFRGQQKEVDAAIALFSGAKADTAREIWLVDSAPVVIDRLKDARDRLDRFMASQGLTGKPGDVANLKGDAARAAFVEHFKQVQKLKVQLDQYTDLDEEQKQQIEAVLPRDEHNAFRGAIWRPRSGCAPSRQSRQGRRTGRPTNRSTSSISSSCCLPPAPSTTTTS